MAYIIAGVLLGMLAFIGLVCAKNAGAADDAAEIERLTAALDAAPVREERAGECWCKEGDRCEIRAADGESYWVRRMLCLGHPGSDTYPPEDDEWQEWEEESEFCCNCGAHLGADGIARRWKERE